MDIIDRSCGFLTGLVVEVEEGVAEVDEDVLDVVVDKEKALYQLLKS